MLERLKKLNKTIEFFSVFDDDFSSFGRIIKDLDVSKIIEAAKKIKNPESGSKYLASVESFENLEIASIIKSEFFGTLPTQVGYCYGHNSLLNAVEWHFSSEINIAVTPLALILGHIWDVKDNTIDSSKLKAFYVPAGTAVETYATTLHYAPCEVAEDGFGWVVALPLGTNTDLDERMKGDLLFAKNKWLIAHPDDKSLEESGAFAGITGTNTQIKY